MVFTRTWVIGIGAVGLAAGALAAVILWLVVTDPVAVAMFLEGA